MCRATGYPEGRGSRCPLRRSLSLTLCLGFAAIDAPPYSHPLAEMGMFFTPSLTTKMKSQQKRVPVKLALDHMTTRKYDAPPHPHFIIQYWCEKLPLMLA